MAGFVEINVCICDIVINKKVIINSKQTFFL